MWIVWTGGNDRLWDRLTVDSLGTFDLLKTISSHPKTPNDHAVRRRLRPAQSLGVPRSGQRAVLQGSDRTGSEPVRPLARRARPSCPPDPFADATKYPGVKIGARGKTVPVGSYYGEPTGIVGLRLFPNPDFDEKARKRWDPERFYNDPNYYFDRDLVRPYRVGDVVRVLPRRTRIRSGRPADPENPKWENLSSNVGAQYFWWDRIFNWRGLTNESSFFYQALHVSRPGTLDTSLVSTDNINNPRTMNAVYYLGPRMGLAKKWGKETHRRRRAEQQAVQRLRAGRRSAGAVLRAAEHDVDAARAEGRLRFGRRARRAESRLHQHRPVQRGVAAALPAADRRQSRSRRFRSRSAQKNSVYWRATEMQTPNMARFFLASTDPHYLKDAPGGHGLSHRRSPRRVRARARWCSPSAARAATRARSRTCPPASISRTPTARAIWRLEPVLGLDEDRGVQEPDAADRARRRLSRRTTTSRPSCASRSRCSASTPAARSRPTRFATTSGTTSRPSRTSSCRRSGRSRFGIRSPAARPTTRCRPAAAATSGPRRSSASGPRRRSSRTTPSVRSSASPSVEARMRVVPGVDRADAVARAARQGRDLCERERPRRRRDRSPDRRQLSRGARRLHSRASSRPDRRSAAGCSRSLAAAAARSGSARSRRACRSASSTNMDMLGADLPAAGAARAQEEAAARCCKHAKRELKRASPISATIARRAHRRDARHQQVQGLRRQQGPLLRHRLLQAKSRA